MVSKQHTLSIHHRHANGDGVVETITEQATHEELEAALQRADALLANSHCRNFGCRIELDGQVVVYTLVRDSSALPGPVRFCRHDAQALARERNTTLVYESGWKVSRALQAPARPSVRARSVSKA